ncbi:MAG: WecB/TagA/CpsF family glycosyltransferase [Candidatus Gracilibacteria bacterium]|jgi:N-acetylglucosaminyldiphosphoundecaprenol N-acetyl-beta-D-mannosaminyltransferase
MQKEKIEILGVRFDNVSLQEATDKAIKLAKGNSKEYMATPNPEIILEAIKNPEFLAILNKSALNVADGTGILWASRYLFKRKVLKERVTGIDLMTEICKKSGEENLKIFLLGATESAGEKAKQKLQEKYPNIKIVGRLSKSPKEEDEKEIIEKINRSGADILFIAYGAPKQELWIARNLPKLTSVHLSIGIGGAFDFIAGTKKRAPKIFRKIGLEWLIRLIQEPKRIKRIWNATVKFPYEVIKRKK